MGSAWSIAGCGASDSALSDRLGLLVAGDVPRNLYRHNLAFIMASSRLYCNRSEEDDRGPFEDSGTGGAMLEIRHRAA